MIFSYKGVCTNGCPDTLNPVCSNNGTQFQNNCFLEKESAALGEGQSLTKLHNGACAGKDNTCLLYTSPSPRDKRQSRMPSSA